MEDNTDWIPLYRHSYGFCKCLKDCFYLMMFIVAFALDIKVALSSVAERLKNGKTFRLASPLSFSLLNVAFQTSQLRPPKSINTLPLHRPLAVRSRIAPFHAYLPVLVRRLHLKLYPVSSMV
jgi:hypothetical protein